MSSGWGGTGACPAAPGSPAPSPGPGHCPLLRSQNGAAGRWPQVRAPRLLSALCLHTRVMTTRGLSFCRWCPRAPPSALDVSPPNTSTPAWPPRTPQVPFSQVSALTVSRRVRLPSPLRHPPPRSVPARCRSSPRPVPALGWEMRQAPGRGVNIWRICVERGTLGPEGLSLSLARNSWASMVIRSPSVKFMVSGAE